MAIDLTEDQVRDRARVILEFDGSADAQCGVGQLTTFNQLGFSGISDKPDGWYLPHNHTETALILEVKASKVALGDKQVAELMKNVDIAEMWYDHVVGILYNGEDTRVFKGSEEIDDAPALQNKEHYLALFTVDRIDKERIYELTARINNCLHFDFGIKNLYSRMIFTACALVAKRYDATMVRGMDYSEFHNAILNCLNKELVRFKRQNQKLGVLTDEFSKIEMNLDVTSEDEKQQKRVKDLIAQFIGWIEEISACINSDAWRGEDVMGIFFNEFNRYKKQNEGGQVFTPEHITDFMYRILDVDMNDRILDATCGSGGFLVKAMANMIQEAGGPHTDKAKAIKQKQLFGIELDKEIYALACANMLIHKDGKTNLEQLDARYESAADWIARQKITKVMMNPPFENKYGCMTIVENVLDHVPPHTMCGFILPDKKLEKMPKASQARLLKHHRLLKVIKLPESLFQNVGITTSIFVFEARVPQNGQEFFACYMAEDGLEAVKNKGRHDVRGKWDAIEDFWVQVVRRQSGDATVQWNDPAKCLSYQMPPVEFSITDEDFLRVAFDWTLYQNGVDAGEFGNKLLSKVMYASEVNVHGCAVEVTLRSEEALS